MPETTPNPKFSRKSGVAPKSPRNSHWIHTKRHTKPHWIPLSSPEFSRNFTNFPEFAQIPPNPWNFLRIRGGEEFTQSAREKPRRPSKNLFSFTKVLSETPIWGQQKGVTLICSDFPVFFRFAFLVFWNALISYASLSIKFSYFLEISYFKLEISCLQNEPKSLLSNPI